MMDYPRLRRQLDERERRGVESTVVWANMPRYRGPPSGKGQVEQRTKVREEGSDRKLRGREGESAER